MTETKEGYLCEWCFPSKVPEESPEKCKIIECVKHGETWHYVQESPPDSKSA